MPLLGGASSGKREAQRATKMADAAAQPELLYGTLTCRLGLTDKHVIALAEALKIVPMIKEIDLRHNFVSEKGIDALLDTIRFHQELAQYDSSATLCSKCENVLHFTHPTRQSATCVDCTQTQWRPTYMLTRVLVREDDETITPRSILKW